MKRYRILFLDDCNGQRFNFAIHVNAKGLFAAERSATSEFPDALIVQITRA